MKKLMMLCLFLGGLMGASFVNASVVWSSAQLTGSFASIEDTQRFYPNFSVDSSFSGFGADSYGFQPVLKLFTADGLLIPTNNTPLSIDFGDEGILYTDSISIPLLAGDYIVELSALPLMNSENIDFLSPLNWSFSFSSEVAGATIGLTAPQNLSGVPVPAAAWLLGSALLGFIGLRRWRN